MTNHPQKLRIVILGCGGSGGVPLIGNYWGECNPNEPKNRRSRPSIYITDGETQVIVDAGPDFREQMNRLDGWDGLLDGIIISHVHADHVSGLDDIRAITFRQNRKPLNLWMRPQDADYLSKSISYLFKSTEAMYPATAVANKVKINSSFKIGSLTFQSFDVEHGLTTTMGIRVGNFAYTSDISAVPQSSFQHLRGVDHWVLGGNVITQPNHLHFTESVKLCQDFNVKNGFLTHLSFHTDYNDLKKQLPENIVPAYDGMEIIIQ